uniref:Ribosomal RNA large subunit methyltransferase H n=1 Tax=uncultured Helicobacter sp. TaxID=175537 RepID=A0A650ELP7_9HELI|nr:ribosomal RNA large subunit methyltransferase H [uncultured Helicobacter sp.]
MQINIYSISKKDSAYKALEDEFVTKCQQFGAQMQVVDLLPKNVLNAQKISPQKARESYTDAFTKYLLPHAFNLAFHPDAKCLDSLQFAEVIQSHSHIHCFIGGAYGLEDTFLKQCKVLSLSPLTFSHKIAKIIVCEQMYRALSILHQHPYHK